MRASFVIGVGVPGVVMALAVGGSEVVGAGELITMVVVCGVVLGIAMGVQVGVWLVWRWLQSCYKSSGRMLEHESQLWLIAVFPWVCCVLSGLAWLILAGLVNW